MSKIRSVFLLICLGVSLVLAGCRQSTEEATATPQPRPTATLRPTDTPQPPPTATPRPTDTPQPPPTATPQPTATPTPSDVAAWQMFVDETHGLSIFYPTGWRFLDPSQDVLAILMATMGEQVATEEVGGLLTMLGSVVQQEDMFVGVGFQIPTQAAAGSAFINNITAVSLPAAGLTLPVYSQLVAAQLDEVDGIQVDAAAVVPSLRPQGAEVVSIRYRADGALYNMPDLEITGWQVGLLSPDTESLLVLTFGIRSHEFDDLEPLLQEMVQRLQFTE